MLLLLALDRSAMAGGKENDADNMKMLNLLLSSLNNRNIRIELNDSKNQLNGNYVLKISPSDSSSSSSSSNTHQHKQQQQQQPYAQFLYTNHYLMDQKQQLSQKLDIGDIFVRANSAASPSSPILSSTSSSSSSSSPPSLDDFNTDTEIEMLGGLALWEFTAIFITSIILLG